MNDVRALLERQAVWQAARKQLSWPEKIRMVEAIHETLRQFRAMRTAGTSRSKAIPTCADTSLIWYTPVLSRVEGTGK